MAIFPCPSPQKKGCGTSHARATSGGEESDGRLGRPQFAPWTDVLKGKSSGNMGNMVKTSINGGLNADNMCMCIYIYTYIHIYIYKPFISLYSSYYYH